MATGEWKFYTYDAANDQTLYYNTVTGAISTSPTGADQPSFQGEYQGFINSQGNTGDLYRMPDGSYQVNGKPVTTSDGSPLTSELAAQWISGAKAVSDQAAASSNPVVDAAPYVIAGLGTYGALSGLGGWTSGYDLAGGGALNGSVGASVGSGAFDTAGFNGIGGTMGVDVAPISNAAIDQSIAQMGGNLSAPGGLSIGVPSAAGSSLIPSAIPSITLPQAGAAASLLGTGINVSNAFDPPAGILNDSIGQSINDVSGINPNGTGVNDLANIGSSTVGPLAGINVPAGGSNVLDTLTQLAKSTGASVGDIAKSLGIDLNKLAKTVGSTLPGYLALQYAKDQPGYDPSQMNGILGQFNGLNTNDLQGVLARLQASDPTGASMDVLAQLKASNPNATLEQILAQVQASDPTVSLSNILAKMQSIDPASSQRDVMGRLQASDPTAALRATLAQAQGNAPGYVQASINPLLKAQAAGYGDLRQSNAARGIGGSSFANDSIGNFLDTTGRGISDAGINAQQSALGLQAGIGQNIGSLENQKLGLQSNLAGNIDSILNQSYGLQGNIAGNIGTLLNQKYGTLANIGQSMGTLTNQNLGLRSSTAGNIGSLMNQNLAMQGQFAGQIPLIQNSILANRGNLAANIANLGINAQANKNNLFGRAFDTLGRGLGNNYGSLSL